MTLEEFLAARLSDDEATAKRAASVAGPDWQYGLFLPDDGPATTMLLSDQDVPLADMLHRDDEEIAPFLIAHDPARVLREVKAKRKILAAHEKSDGGYCELCYYGYGGGSWPCPTVRALAAVYGDHPDYDKAWRP